MYEYEGEHRLPFIGATRHGRMLELVAVPAGAGSPPPSRNYGRGHAAREAGDSWTVIAAAVEITRQAAQQRYRDR